MNSTLRFISSVLLAAGAIPAMTASALTVEKPSLKEDFNSMWDATSASGTLELPEGWRVDRNLDAPRRVGPWSGASSSLMYQGGVNLASNAKNGTWNFGAADSDRAIGGLTTTVNNGTRGVSLMTCVVNEDPSKIITSLAISYNVEKYRKGANTAGFRVQLFTSADGTGWTSAGDAFNTFFEPDSETAGMASVPCTSIPVGADLRTHVEAGEPLYLAWNISVASGSSPDKAQGLAIDDISIMATFADTDPDWQNPTPPAITHSGIYLRGVDGWDATDDWEFNKLSDTTFELRDKTISGSFKIADDSWSSDCNYGSNGTNIVMSMPYELKANVNDNISCGSNVFKCSRILLTIADGKAQLLLEPDDSMEGLTSVYLVGDFNGWNYMNADGRLDLNETSGAFEGRVTLSPGDDGLSHWRLYQRLGMAGAWGLTADASAESPLSGSLVKNASGSLATKPGTYDISVRLSPDGASSYTLAKVESPATSLTLTPAETVLVPELTAAVRVLSLNNSLIHYNDQSQMFNDIAKAMGRDAEWTKHTLLGKSLATHWEEGDGLAGDGQPGARMMVRSQPWTHIILQEQSSLPRTNPEQFRKNVKTWVEYIRQNCPNPNAIIIMPVNWAYYGDWANFSGFNDIFLKNYINVADEFGLVLCPVMNAYQLQYDEKGADGLSPWFQDDRHPTDMSTYMAACMEYALIFNQNPESISCHPSSVAESDAHAMRSVAARTLSSFSQTVDHHNATVRLRPVVKDAFGLELPAENLTFSVDSPDASISADGVFHAVKPAVYTVTASASGFSAEARIAVTKAVTEMPEIVAVRLNADNPSYFQDFNGMGTAADAAMPEAWRIDRTDTPRAVGSFRTAVENTVYSGGVSLPSNAKNGIWNLGPDDNDRAVGGITTGVANGTRAVNAYLRLLNNGKREISSLDISFDVEKYRDGNNAAGFRVQLFTSTDGHTWKSAGESLMAEFPASTATAGSSVVPIETRSVSAPLEVVFSPGCDLYLAWNISVASGDQCQGAPALAIDNVRINAIPKPVPVYSCHIYIEDKTGYDAMGVYAYGDKEIWGAWPGQAPIDEKTIDGVTYKVFGHNEASGSYNIIVNNWNRSLQLPDFTIKGGRDYYFTATPSSLVEKVSTGATAVEESTETLRLEDGLLAGSDGETLDVYNACGILMLSGNSPLAIENLPAGLYIASQRAPLATLRFMKR